MGTNGHFMEAHEAFFSRVKREMLGCLPGYYSSRKLIYDIIKKSSPVPGSVHIEIGTLCGGGTIFMFEALRAKEYLTKESIVCVDPFDGFYENKDSLGTDTVLLNLSRFGYSKYSPKVYQTTS
jgi:hypothetical protein